MNRRFLSAALTLSVVSLAAGCGSSATSKSSGTSTTVGVTTAASAPSAQSATGTPYDLWFTDTGDGAAGSYLSAITDAVNARGGIHGRPVKIVHCVDNNDPNQATQCGQKAVSDKNALAVIDNDSSCSSQLLDILAKAHMASVGDQFFCPEDFKSSVVFPFEAGALRNGAGAALAAITFHSPTVVNVTVDVPAGREGTAAVAAVVGSKAKVVGVYLPLTGGDLAPFAAQIGTYKGVMLGGLTEALGIRLGQALKQQGYNEPVLYNPSTFDASIIEKNFGNPTNAYLLAPYNLTSPGYKMFDTEMKKFAPGVSYRGSDLLTAWLAANVIVREANEMTAPTAPQLFDRLSSSTALSTFGLTIPLNFTKPATFLQGIASRAVNPCVALYHFTNGTWTETAKFTDLLDAPGSSVACTG